MCMRIGGTVAECTLTLMRSSRFRSKILISRESPQLIARWIPRNQRKGNYSLIDSTTSSTQPWSVYMWLAYLWFLKILLLIRDSPKTRVYKTIWKTGSTSNQRVFTLKPSTYFLQAWINVTMLMVIICILQLFHMHCTYNIAINIYWHITVVSF